MKTDLRKKYQATPTAVQTAVMILWACFGIGILNTFFVATHPIPLPPGAHLMQLVIFGFEALIIAMIGRGRNWARITFLIICLLGFVSVILLMHVMLRLNGPLSFLIVLAESILQYVALILLFQREASEWFRGGQRSGLTPQNRIRERVPYSYARFQ